MRIHAQLVKILTSMTEMTTSTFFFSLSSLSLFEKEIIEHLTAIHHKMLFSFYFHIVAVINSMVLFMKQQNYNYFIGGKRKLKISQIENTNRKKLERICWWWMMKTKSYTSHAYRQLLSSMYIYTNEDCAMRWHDLMWKNEKYFFKCAIFKRKLKRKQNRMALVRFLLCDVQCCAYCIHINYIKLCGLFS